MDIFNLSRFGSSAQNRTEVNGFGDRYTNRCATELNQVLEHKGLYRKVIFVKLVPHDSNEFHC